MVRIKTPSFVELMLHIIILSEYEQYIETSVSF